LSKGFVFWLGWFAKKLRLLAWLVRQKASSFGLAGSPKDYVFWLRITGGEENNESKGTQGVFNQAIAGGKGRLSDYSDTGNRAGAKGFAALFIKCQGAAGSGSGFFAGAGRILAGGN